MKKILISILLSAACFSLFAQTESEPKKTDNLYLGVGIGGMSVINDGFNSPTLNGHIQLGQYITPVWGWRAEVAGAWQKLGKQLSGYEYTDGMGKAFGELNLDATLNVLNLFGKSDWERKFNVYVFGGPQIFISSAVSMDQQVEYAWSQTSAGTTATGYTASATLTPIATYTEFTSEGCLARAGVSAGAGLSYNLNDKLALKGEVRYAVAPSAFGYGSDCSFSESTLRGTIGLTYALTTKSHNAKKQAVPACPACPAVKPCPEPAPCPAVEPAPAPAAKAEEEIPANKEAATKIVDNELAVFFTISSAVISADDYAKVKEYAEYIKANPDQVFLVTGYADKATGTKAFNQKISEKRADSVYNLLVKDGVNPSQLRKIGAGGVGVMFHNDTVYSRVAVTRAL